MRLLLFLIPLALSAQSASSVMDFITIITKPPTTVLTVTASQGDGTICTAGKVASSAIYLSVTCSNLAYTSNSTLLKASGLNQTSLLINLGDVFCTFLVNPTATALVAQGSWTAIPANAVGWQCSTYIRSTGTNGLLGPITGETAVVAGSVSWP